MPTTIFFEFTKYHYIEELCIYDQLNNLPNAFSNYFAQAKNKKKCIELPQAPSIVVFSSWFTYFIYLFIYVYLFIILVCPVVVCKPIHPVNSHKIVCTVNSSKPVCPGNSSKPVCRTDVCKSVCPVNSYKLLYLFIIIIHLTCWFHLQWVTQLLSQFLSQFSSVCLIYLC